MRSAPSFDPDHLCRVCGNPIIRRVGDESTRQWRGRKYCSKKCYLPIVKAWSKRQMAWKPEWA